MAHHEIIINVQEIMFAKYFTFLTYWLENLHIVLSAQNSRDGWVGLREAHQMGSA
jgi:hypothetical protein